MNVAIDAPKRPALRWYGGKWDLAKWIIGLFPYHLNYVEPCMGACSVLFQKPRSALETVNDIDGNIVNFFQVLRDRPDELTERIRLTPWARAEYQLSWESCDEPVESARRFFVSSWMSMQGGAHEKTSKTWRMNPHAEQRFVLPAEYHSTMPKHLLTIAQRLVGVQIDNRNALDVIERYDNKDSLIYFDPPYVPETRGHSNMYRFEVDKDFHTAAANLLRQCAGYVVVSGYACPLYTDLYERHGWERHDKEAQTNSGGKRIESVWLSPRTVEALARPRQGSLI